MFDGRFRQAVDKKTLPLGEAMVRLGFSADVLTGSGLVFAAATAWLIASGHHDWAILALILTGAHDLFDGAVAKASHAASIRGAFFDSVTDRLADALLMGGVAYSLLATHHGTLVLVPMGILTASSLISYERAKAESLGIKARGGLMERAERLILLGVALLTTATFIPVLWILLALTSATAVGRFVRVWREAGKPPRPSAVPPRTRRRAERPHRRSFSRTLRPRNRTLRP